MNVKFLNATPLRAISLILKALHDHPILKTGSLEDHIALLKPSVSEPYQDVLDQIIFTFDISLSRVCLNTLLQRKIDGMSIKPMKGLLLELANERPFSTLDSLDDMMRMKKYVTLTDEPSINAMIKDDVEKVRAALVRGLPIEKIAYALPGAFNTSIVWSVNAPMLRQFGQCRTKRLSMLQELCDMATMSLSVIPPEYKGIFEG